MASSRDFLKPDCETLYRLKILTKENMISTTQYFLPQLASRRARDGMVRDGEHHSRQARQEKKRKVVYLLLNLIC